MANLWFITVPEATTNYVLNPSAEVASNFTAHNSATVTRDTAYSRHGVYSYKIVPGGVDRGISLTLSAFPNAAAYISFYVFGTITGNLNISMDAGVNYSTAAIIGGMTGGAVRYGFALSSVYANGSVALIIRNTVSETFYIDAVQVEAKGYPTTYCDGSLPGLHRWSGLYHGSTSSRDAQERRGGHEVDLEATYGVTVRMPTSGLGMPPVINNLQDMSLQPGSIYQSYTVLPNSLDLAMTFPGTSQTNLHTIRQLIIDLLKPDAARGSQPFVIGYAGAGLYKKVYNEFYYADGLPYGDVTRTVEQPSVRVVSVNPFWYEDNQAAAALDYQDTFTGGYGAVRSNGDWGSLGTGFNGIVYAIAEDKQNGRIYFGGAFSTANGVTVNGITYWNGTTFVAMGGTPGVSGGNADVYAIAVAPNGDVWIGGEFTDVGGSTSDGVAYWDISAGAWVQITVGTAGDDIYSIAINSTGIVYIAGDFTNWNAVAAADYIAQFDGSAWTAVGTPSLSANNFPRRQKGMAFDANDVLYIGTVGISGGNLYSVSGTTWTTIATVSGANSDIYALEFNAAGELYVAGGFTTITPNGGIAQSIPDIALYNGSSFSGLGSGVSGGVTEAWAIDSLDTNSFIIGGGFTTAGGITVPRIALWNGYTWANVDISWGATYYALLVSKSRDIYFGGTGSATATVAGLTSITPTATALTFPVITIINGNTSGSCTLQWLENQSMGKILFFNLTIQAGETITIDFRTGQKQVTSDWRGLIYGQPLDNSDFGSFGLLPARPDDGVPNVISTLITGTVTTVSAVVNWVPRHWSGDGAAQ
jgi:hypothetical protein